MDAKTVFCEDCATGFLVTKAGRPPSRCDACRTERKRVKACEAQARQRMKNPGAAKIAYAKWIAENPEYRERKNREFYEKNREQQKLRTREWRAANPDKHKAATLKWRLENAEYFAEVKAKWRRDNEEYARQYRKAQYALTRERELAKAREWKANNKERCNAHAAKRISAKMRATPPWADFDLILEFYAEAVRVTRETGIPHHVDHIVPLQSKWVCGLHVHTNLQILPASENQSKSNRYWPDMLAEPRSFRPWPPLPLPMQSLP